MAIGRERQMIGRLVLRQVGVRVVVLELVVAALVGGLASLMVFYVSWIPFDRVWFEEGLAYSTKLTGGSAPTTGVSVLRTEGVDVTSSLTAASSGDYSGATQTEVMMFDPQQVDQVDSIMGSSVVSGALRTGAVALDQASAADLHVEQGDLVEVAYLDVDTATCRVRISAIVRPYESDQMDMGRGLVLLPGGTCPAVEKALEKNSQFAWDSYNVSGPDLASARSKSEVMSSLLGYAIRVSPLTSVILVVSLVLWFFGARWGFRHVADRARDVAANLVVLGVSPRRLRWLVRLGFAAVLLVSAAVAGTVAATAMVRVTGFYAQPALRVLTLVVLVAVGLCGTFGSSMRRLVDRD